MCVQRLPARKAKCPCSLIWGVVQYVQSSSAMTMTEQQRSFGEKMLGYIPRGLRKRTLYPSLTPACGPSRAWGSQTTQPVLPVLLALGGEGPREQPEGAEQTGCELATVSVVSGVGATGAAETVACLPGSGVVSWEGVVTRSGLGASKAGKQ